MKHSKSSLFLMELIIVILFFSLASAVCVQLFARSHILSEGTVDQNNAITRAQNMAETWYAAEGSLDTLQQLLENSIRAEDGSAVFTVYDSRWNPLGADSSSESSEVSYVAELALSAESVDTGLLHATVSVYSLVSSEVWQPVRHALSEASEDMIYSIDLTLHNAERRGSLE